MIDFLAFKHHMRWLKPRPDILASAKRDWGKLFKRHLKLFDVDGWRAKCSESYDGGKEAS